MNHNAYDALAPYYVEYARSRAAYCESVDSRLLDWLPPRIDAMLDVGTGDGSRAVRLAKAMSAARLVLSDPSHPMVELCRGHHVSDIWHCRAEELPADTGTFDIVTCLWNVLGAIGSAAGRLEALRRMGALISADGRLYIDVHNRYNIATAGVSRVLVRRIRDLVWPSHANGEIAFVWEVAGQQIPSHGYLFTRREMHRLVVAAGLRVVHEEFVDYDDGRTSEPWAGQMLLCLARAPSARSAPLQPAQH